ncbi:peroxidase-related enzyme [Acidobacteriia bacterium AH_259_A11_L15]|nr:peroxidase-related enzyme [Acidobacteriia bacterium AH_259_A11_L15]
MSFISLVSAEQASPALKQLYEQIQQQFGFLPNYFQALGRAPQVVAGHLALGEAVMREGALPAALKEQIGMVVSGLNTSSYCIAIHMEVLRKLAVEKKLGKKLATDYEHAPVEEKRKALFRFADKLTRQPDEISRADLETLRQAGWDEQALVETVLVVSWFNFINRFSLGLGLVADF